MSHAFQVPPPNTAMSAGTSGTDRLRSSSECAMTSPLIFAHAEPRVFIQRVANEEGTEVAVVQVHPDVDSMVFHMNVIAERAAAAYAGTIDATTSIQVFGTPSGAITELLGRQAGARVPLTIKPHHLGGFTR
jgi:hypothetical protein